LKAYIAGRIVQGIILIFAIIILNFIIIHSAPGSVVDYLAGTSGASSQAENELIIKQFGLDQPLTTQLYDYVRNVVQGNLGTSYVYGLPVTSVIAANLFPTVLLVGVASVISGTVGIFIGVVSSRKKGGTVDTSVGLMALIGYALPTFWLGQLVLIAFAYWFPFFPSAGMQTVGGNPSTLQVILDVGKHLVLPALVLAAYQTALIARMTRTNMIENMRKDFITTARAKGLTEWQVMVRHGLRNSLNPIVTLIGINFGFMLAGAVLTETVFSWPGIGTLLYNSMLARDFPVILGILLLISISVISATIITDVLYAYLDPRIKLGAGRVI
jgi:peptide/nickel transport system permease protein